MRIFVWCLLIWVSTITCAGAITLKQAIQQTLDSSEKAESIRFSRYRAEAEAKKVTAFTLPQINATASYLELEGGTEIYTGIPALDQELLPYDHYYSAKLEASQLLFSGGRIWSSYDMKHELMQLAQLQEKSQKTELVKQVSYAFINFLYQQARLAVLQDRVSQRKEELQDATDLFEAGMVTNLDVREARLHLHVAMDDLQSGESAYHAALVDFNLVIGQSADAKRLQPAGELERPEAMNQNIDQIKALVEKNTQLTLQLAEHQWQAAKASLDMAKGERWPLLMLVAGGEYSGEESSDMDETLRVGVQVKWNLYDGGMISSKKASAGAEMRSQKALLAQTRKQLYGTIEKLRTEVDRLDKRIALQEKTVTLSHDNYEDARGLYGQGTMTLTRLGEFNLLYAEARFNLLRLYFLENRIALDIEALLQ